MRNYILIIYTIICISCSDEKYMVIDNRQVKSVDHEINAKNYVSFYPRILSKNKYDVVSGYSVFPEDCLAEIYVYNSGDTLLDAASYKSFTSGSLSPVELPIEVTSGEYDFYAVSTKNLTSLPEFTNGKAFKIANEIDYLWYSIINQSISNSTTLPIYFSHSASQVFVTIENSSTDNIADWISFAMMATPVITSDMCWDLFTGVITPSSSLTTDSLLDMSASGLTCYEYIVPTINSPSIYFYVSLKIKNEEQAQGYEIDLPVPDSVLLAGKSYHYNILFGSDTIYINNVNIESWIEVDETGNPIYPQIITN